MSSRYNAFAWIHLRIHHHYLHGHKKVSGQRRISLFMAIFAAMRTVFWLSMMVQQVLGVTWVVDLAHNVSFVAFISFYANCATDFGTMTAGIAALFSADSHHDSEATRAVVEGKAVELKADIAKLAHLLPGSDADSLAEQIFAKLGTVGA